MSAVKSPEMLEAALEVMRPLERVAPAEFAAMHRHLKEGTTAAWGRWSNDVFPYLVPIMDAVQEAIETGRFLVLMKSGQGGGSEAMINALAWLQTFFPGPYLYLISKDDLAKEFSRDRFGYVNETCAPLARKHLGGKVHGELLQVKRYTDGKLDIRGSQSALNLQSSPYRGAFVDEYDSLLDEIAGHGDPMELIKVRLDAFAEFGETVVVAFAHPSTPERGCGDLYYKHSDQRRGFVRCPHCPGSFWLRWEDVKCPPSNGQTIEQAERDPSAYVYVTPCCGVALTDAQRFSACRRVEQRSTMPPGEAGSKKWIGVHFSQLYMQKPILDLAQRFVGCLDEPSKMRVFRNKVLGDVYEQTDQDAPVEAWQALLTDDYELGEVPEPVQFLTAGQDSNLLDLHWAVWGWGLVRTAAGGVLLCGWLVDAGVEPGPAATDRARKTLDASDLHVFDQVLYDRFWPRRGGGDLRVDVGYHDSGWQPIAAYEYARTRLGRAIPSKGAAELSTSRAPAVKWAEPPKWRVVDVHGQEHEISDPSLRRADMNTYMLKTDLLGWPATRFAGAGGAPRPRLVLPEGTPPEFIAHLASERLVADGGKKAWRKRGPNHWLDCTVMAYAAALQLAPFLRGQTREEQVAARPPAPPPAPRHEARAARFDDEEDHGGRGAPIRTRY